MKCRIKVSNAGITSYNVAYDRKASFLLLENYRLHFTGSVLFKIPDILSRNSGMVFAASIRKIKRKLIQNQFIASIIIENTTLRDRKTIFILLIYKWEHNG